MVISRDKSRARIVKKVLTALVDRKVSIVFQGLSDMKVRLAMIAVGMLLGKLERLRLRERPALVKKSGLL